MKHHVKVLSRATHDICQLQVLKDIRRQFHHLILMGCTEIDIVVENGTV